MPLMIIMYYFDASKPIFFLKKKLIELWTNQFNLLSVFYLFSLSNLSSLIGTSRIVPVVGSVWPVDLVPGLPDSSGTGKGYVSRGKSYYLNVATDGTKTVSNVITIIIIIAVIITFIIIISIITFFTESFNWIQWIDWHNFVQSIIRTCKK